MTLSTSIAGNIHYLYSRAVPLFVLSSCEDERTGEKKTQNPVGCPKSTRTCRFLFYLLTNLLAATLKIAVQSSKKTISNTGYKKSGILFVVCIRKSDFMEKNCAGTIVDEY